MTLIKESLKLFTNISKNLSLTTTRCPVRNLQTISQPIINQTFRQEVSSCVKPSTNQPVLSSNISKPLYNHECIRTIIKHFYRRNAWKRIHKHGIEARLDSPHGRETMLTRYMRGRRHLAVTDRFMNHVIEKKQKGRRINLFDPKKGYRSLKVKKPEYYRFDTYQHDRCFTKF